MSIGILATAYLAWLFYRNANGFREFGWVWMGKELERRPLLATAIVVVAIGTALLGIALLRKKSSMAMTLGWVILLLALGLETRGVLARSGDERMARSMVALRDLGNVAEALRNDKCEFPETLPATVLTDPSRLRQIVTNLVGNALKFTQRGSVGVTLRMQADAGPPRLVIDISDTGIGIAPDKLDAIFEPFVQAEASTTRQFGGTGLGLAISRRFARALGGDVTVSSVAGQGSTFRVTLETGSLQGVNWLEPQALTAAREAPAVIETSSWIFPRARVLVVDDGPENRELVRLVLEAAGLAVVEAENGAVALDTLGRETVDLVLMDVQMPVMDGYTATRMLRERGCTTPVLALTANAMKGFEREIDAAGFSGHLTKPVDIDAMLAELAQRLGCRRIEASANSGATTAAASVATVVPLRASAAPDSLPIESRLANHPRLRKVVRSFGEQLPARLQAMHAALAAGELDALAQLAHWLKGAGGTVGFDVFFEPARQLEQHVKNSDLALVQEALQQLQALSRRIVIPDELPVSATASTPQTFSAA